MPPPSPKKPCSGHSCPDAHTDEGLKHGVNAPPPPRTPSGFRPLSLPCSDWQNTVLFQDSSPGGQGRPRKLQPNLDVGEARGGSGVRLRHLVFTWVVGQLPVRPEAVAAALQTSHPTPCGDSCFIAGPWPSGISTPDLQMRTEPVSPRSWSPGPTMGRESVLSLYPPCLGHSS